MKIYLQILGVSALAVGFFIMGKVGVIEGSMGGGGNPKILRIEPYNCGDDPCMGYRCVGGVGLDSGTSVSPACYNGAELEAKNCRKGAYEYIPDFNLTCHEASYYYVWVR